MTTPTMTELETAVAELCISRNKLDTERDRARAEIAGTLDPADRAALECYTAALGRAIDKLDAALALSTELLPDAELDLENAELVLEHGDELLAGNRGELLAVALEDPSTATWRRAVALRHQLEEASR